MRRRGGAARRGQAGPSGQGFLSGADRRLVAVERRCAAGPRGRARGSSRLVFSPRRARHEDRLGDPRRLLVLVCSPTSRSTSFHDACPSTRVSLPRRSAGASFAPRGARWLRSPRRRGRGRRRRHGGPREARAPETCVRIDPVSGSTNAATASSRRKPAAARIGPFFAARPATGRHSAAQERPDGTAAGRPVLDRHPLELRPPLQEKLGPVAGGSRPSRRPRRAPTAPPRRKEEDAGPVLPRPSRASAARRGRAAPSSSSWKIPSTSAWPEAKKSSSSFSTASSRSKVPRKRGPPGTPGRCSTRASPPNSRYQVVLPARSATSKL